jgi:repressor LexA
MPDTASSRRWRPLTRRQHEVYGFIATRIRFQGIAPTFEEIARQFGFHSLATVHEHLGNLERKGYIRRYRNEARAIELLATDGHCPHCGAIQPIERSVET